MLHSLPAGRSVTLILALLPLHICTTGDVLRTKSTLHSPRRLVAIFLLVSAPDARSAALANVETTYKIARTSTEHQPGAS